MEEGERKLSSQRCQGGMRGTGNHTQPLPPERLPRVCGVTSFNAMLGGSELKEAVMSRISSAGKSEAWCIGPSKTRENAIGFVFKEHIVAQNAALSGERREQGRRSVCTESDKLQSAVHVS